MKAIFSLLKKTTSWCALSLVILQISVILFFNTCQEQPNPLPKEVFSKKQEHDALLEEIKVFENKTHLVANLMEGPGKKLGRIQIFIPETCEQEPKTKIRFFAKVSEITSFQNPGVFDYKTHLNHQGIWGKAFLKTCKEITVLQKAEPNFFLKIKRKIETDIDRFAKKHPEILKCLILGTNGIDSKNKELIRKAGLAHLFVISGLHFGMMTLILFWISGLVWRSLPAHLKNFPKQKFASVITIIFVIFYLLITEDHPSLRRAGVMISLYLLAILLEKQSHLLQILLVSLGLNLLIHPTDLFALSAQLSYLCVFLLALVLPYLQDTLPGIKKIKTPFRQILELVLTTTCLTLALTPLLSLHFEQIALSGLFHNLWAIPAFQIFLMPLAMATLFLSSFSLPFVSDVIFLWDKMTDLFLNILKFFSPWQPEILSPFSPHGIPVVLFYIMVFSFVIFRKKFFAKLAFALLLFSLCAIYFQNHSNDDLKITQIDVGQGDAILIQTKTKNILIDTGGHYYLDIGALVLTPYFRHKWIKTLDLVILTHSDIDHYAGLDSLLGKIQIKEVGINPFPSEDLSYKALLQKLQEKNIKITALSAPKQIPLDEQTSLEILSPSLENNPFPKDNDNDQSLVIQLKHKNFTALFPGDISKSVERYLARTFGQNLKSQFLKVSHHGSPSSTSSDFLNMVRPEIASIGVGQRSRFGHPSKKALDRLQRVSAQIYRTDHHGAIEYIVKEKNLDIRPFVGKEKIVELR